MLEPQNDELLKEFGLERYRYILQQVGILNENVYKILGMYQTLATTLVGAALALFVGYRKWQIPSDTARSGIIGLLCLETVIAAFAILLIGVGILSWVDYRREEVELIGQFTYREFRSAPRLRNSWRWYETYIIAFVALSTAFMWFYACTLILPSVK